MANSSDQKIRLFQAILDSMFKDYSVDNDDNACAPMTAFDQSKGRLTIALLTGESINVPFSSSMEVLDLKRWIKQDLNHDIEKQKLLYKDQELTVSINVFMFDCLKLVILSSHHIDV